MSSAMNHAKRSHRSHFKSRAFSGGRASVITPSLHKQHSFNLIRMLSQHRRKQPAAQKGRIDDGNTTDLSV